LGFRLGLIVKASGRQRVTEEWPTRFNTFSTTARDTPVLGLFLYFAAKDKIPEMVKNIPFLSKTCLGRPPIMVMADQHRVSPTTPAAKIIP
jgi:hypothetical protein